MEIKVGILGNGLVGKEVLRLIKANDAFIISKVGVQNLSGRNEVLFTEDLMSIANDPEIDVVVEAINGIEPAESVLIRALSNGKTVISCNKELWSMSGDKVIEAAKDGGSTIWLNSLVCNPNGKQVTNEDITDKTIRSFLPEMLYCFRGGGHIDAAKFLYKDILKATNLL
jgi:homoserine dehydrogenase